MTTPWPPRSVTLVLTAACNLNCTYCYQTARRPARMPWRTANAAVDLLLASTAPPRALVLTGGEPLLVYPMVRRIIERVRAAGPAGRGTRITLLTNGTLLGAAQMGFLADYRVDVSLSLDGTPAAQQSRGSWTSPRLDRLLDDSRLARRSWFTRHLRVAVTLTPEHVPHLADSIEYLLGKGVRSIQVAPAIGGNSPWDVGLLPVLEAQVARLCDVSLAMFRTNRKVPLSMFGPRSHASGSQAMCGVAEGSKITVDTDGEVYNCTPAVASLLRHPSPLLAHAVAASHLGRVADANLPSGVGAYQKALRATGLFGRRDGLHSWRGACRRCRYVGWCVVCPYTIAHAPGATDPTRVPDFTCAFNYVVLKYAERFNRRAARAAATMASTIAIGQHRRRPHVHTRVRSTP